MSLKSKLEAVIYAAEDPVTLAQLADLLAHELSAAAAHTVTSEAGHMSAGEAAATSTEEVAASTLPDLPPYSEHRHEADEFGQIEFTVVADEKKAAKNRERDQRAALKAIVDELIAEYAASERGMEIREIAGGYRMSTKPEYHDVVRAFVKNLKPVMKLSLQALETLAIVAYKQPVTSPEVSEIRGVESAGALSTLLTRKLITTAGRKQVIGRPILYKTTKDFLLRFGLKDVQELPSMEEFEKMAAEINEPDEAPDIALPELEVDAASDAALSEQEPGSPESEPQDEPQSEPRPERDSSPS